MTVYRIISSGQLPAVRVGKSYRLREEDVGRAGHSDERVGRLSHRARDDHRRHFVAERLGQLGVPRSDRRDLREDDDAHARYTFGPAARIDASTSPKRFAKFSTNSSNVRGMLSGELHEMCALSRTRG